MQKLISIIGLLSAVAACAPLPVLHGVAPAALPPKLAAVPIAPPFDVGAEAARLGAALGREVPQAVHDTPAVARGWIALSRAQLAGSGEAIDRPQLLVVVDRNPWVQQLRLVLARRDAAWQDIGGSPVSTGDTGRRGYYLTPTGVFAHTDLILDWRAQGTFNEHHIRGLGLKGMRVWDFGWQEAARGWGSGDEGEIRLLMHATDPTYLERRLGHPASKGCVRIPDLMNRFLDRHGVLDADYERRAEIDSRYAALLASDRVPTLLAGDLLVVVDSSAAPGPAG